MFIFKEGGALYDKTKSELVFHPTGKITTAYIPSTVSRIQLSSLRWCTLLERIEVNNDNQVYCSVDGLLYDKNKQNLLFCPQNRNRDVVVANGVTKICEKAFYYNQGIKNIELPDSLKEIGSCAFRECAQLRSIVIPASVEKIGDFAFYYSSRLKNVTVKAETPPECSIMDVFCNDTYRVAKLHIPKGCKSVYASADAWSHFEEVEEIESKPNEHAVEKGTVSVNFLSGEISFKEISCKVYVYKSDGTMDYKLNLDCGSSQIIILENCSCDILVGDKVTHIVM